MLQDKGPEEDRSDCCEEYGDCDAAPGRCEDSRPHAPGRSSDRHRSDTDRGAERSAVGNLGKSVG
eukprot:5646024-Lingulodinium_polyedra.AAC.1